MFSYENAVEKFTMFLRKLETSYKSENKESADKRVKSIQTIITNDELLRKMIDIQLLNDIIEIVKEYDNNDDFRKSIVINGFNLLSACIEGGIKIQGLSSVSFGEERIEFSSSEDLKKYLFEQVGFIDNKTNEAEAEQYKRNNIYYLLDDLNNIGMCETPAHMENSRKMK